MNCSIPFPLINHHHWWLAWITHGIKDSWMCAKIGWNAAGSSSPLKLGCPYRGGCGADIFTFKLPEAHHSSCINETWQKCGGNVWWASFVPAAGTTAYCFPRTSWYSVFLDSIHEAIISAVLECLEICIITWSCYLHCAPYPAAKMCRSSAFLVTSKSNHYFSPFGILQICKLSNTSLKK